ncbi:FecR family protein [uncultured Tenacibaculum sp.]|uniref:FecR family protein n=1 Tax=uncultured Tenacibaculum sp. TaxID=174713 RepID=UPI002621BA50|nr:FecR family protein [uncultured Tenacibaculum sp.]
MRDKKYHTIQDLLEDKSFNSWALDTTDTKDSFWDVWVKENSTHMSLAAEAKDIIVGINFKQETVSKEKIDTEWEKLEAKLQNKKNSTKNKRTFKLNYFSAAASLLLFISLSVFVYTNFSTVTHKTAYGEMLDVSLKDGSIVTLNSNSSISYKKNDPRNIKLSGEAYFKVEKDLAKQAKFKVTTKDLIVEVYGTQFNVKTSEDKTNVFLEEGSVLLNLNNGKAQKMIPGNYIEYSSLAQKIVVNENNNTIDDHISWKNGNLIFDNATLEEALAKVSENYGIEFKYNKTETKDILITGKVPTTDLEICLNAIKKSTNIKIQKENSILVVYKN